MPLIVYVHGGRIDVSVIHVALQFLLRRTFCEPAGTAVATTVLCAKRRTIVSVNTLRGGQHWYSGSSTSTCRTETPSEHVILERIRYSLSHTVHVYARICALTLACARTLACTRVQVQVQVQVHVYARYTRA